MRIAVIGTGQMGRHLAIALARAGHEIYFGSRQPDAKADAVEVPEAKVVDIEEALETAEVVIIAIPFTAVETFAQEYSSQLRHKLVIDVTNPFGNLPSNRIGGAEITAAAIGEGARVVAAFKANFWEILLEPVDPDTGMIRDVQFAGGDETDKQIVTRLIEELGFQPVDCGSLANARVLDGMVPLLLELDRRYANGERRASWKLLA